ncbi:MAG: SsrA-binding protein SmpB [Endomicrobiia bacterium]
MDVNKIVVNNKRAYHDYEIIEEYEAGVALKGAEVKSLRTSKASIQDSFCKIQNGEIFIYNMHIAPYEYTGSFKYHPKRPRKLLLHKNEINRLLGKTTQKGLTIIPLKVYFNKRGLAKVSIGLAKKRKIRDKKEYLKKKDLERQFRQEL